MFKTFQMELAGRPLIIETGKMAKQASGAVLVRYGETVVLVTSTGSKEAREGTCLLYTSDAADDAPRV